MSKIRLASAMMQEWEETGWRMQTEAKIRADERRKFAGILKEKIETDIVHIKPKYMQPMIDAILSDFCDCVDEILSEYEREQKND